MSPELPRQIPYATNINQGTAMKRPGILLVLAALATASACQKAPQQLPAQDLDIAFELTDQSGDAVTSDMYAGRLRLVFFGFTSCEDVCPITLNNISVALDSLGPLANQVTVLFISVDPKRDTPPVLRRYTEAFHPSVVGLTGTFDQLSRVAAGFHTAFAYNAVADDGRQRPLSREQYEALSPTASYVPSHSSRVYLIGTDNHLLDTIAYGSSPRLIEEKLRQYL
jgi:protein SCO1